jgi:hypothetical protein
MYTVKHSNVFFALVDASFGNYGHHQANVIQKFKKSGYMWSIKMLSLTVCIYNLFYYCLLAYWLRKQCACYPPATHMSWDSSVAWSAMVGQLRFGSWFLFRVFCSSLCWYWLQGLLGSLNMLAYCYYRLRRLKVFTA